jgi:hypothetical protein
VYSDDEETRKWNEVNRPSGGGVMDDGVTGRWVAMVELSFCVECEQEIGCGSLVVLVGGCCGIRRRCRHVGECWRSMTLKDVL